MSADLVREPEQRDVCEAAISCSLESGDTRQVCMKHRAQRFESFDTFSNTNTLIEFHHCASFPVYEREKEENKKVNSDE